MSFSPLTSWQIDGETMETVTDFIFLGSKTTADDDCSHEIKRHLLLGRKAMTNLDSILKSRDITLPTKVCLVKAMVFPIVTYGCESWTGNKAEHWRTDAFKLWCWRRLLRVPWTARRSNQPWILVGKTDAKAETSVFWSSHGNSWLIGKVPDAGKDLHRRRGCQRMRWLDGITDAMTWTWANFRRWWGRGRPGVLQSMGSQRVRHEWVSEQQQQHSQLAEIPLLLGLPYNSLFYVLFPDLMNAGPHDLMNNAGLHNLMNAGHHDLMREGHHEMIQAKIYSGFSYQSPFLSDLLLNKEKARTD